MDKFLEIYIFPKLNHKPIENLSRPITNVEIESVIKNVPTNRIPGPDSFTGEFYQRWKEELIPLLLKLYQKIEKEGKLPSTFYKGSITQISRQGHHKENYRPVSLMNINE